MEKEPMPQSANPDVPKSGRRDLKNAVLRRIAEGKARMRPKWHFVLIGVLYGLCAAILALALIFLVSFKLYFLRQTGLAAIPAFGGRGLLVFMLSLPWFLIGLALVLIVVLELLVRHYAFAYRRPVLYSALGIVILVTVGAVGIAQTSLHSVAFREAQRRHLPFIGQFYQNYVLERLPNVQRGVFVTSTPGGFILTNQWDEDLTVLVASDTALPYEQEFAPGDLVVVFGDPEDSSTMDAVGVRKAGGDFIRGPLPQPGMTHHPLPPPFDQDDWDF
jgi:hypothetical protein